MLNISPNSILDKVSPDAFSAYSKTELAPAHRMFVRWLVAAFVIFLIFMFLPWTQNIQSKGIVTPLNPEDRPQTVHATIAGRIEKWYVQEGELVQKGDTLLYLSEIKAEYFDPDLVPRTRDQVQAKEGSVGGYQDKIRALSDQIEALQEEQKLKMARLRNKIQQAKFKITEDSIELERAKVALSIAETQLQRQINLFERDIAPRKAIEDHKAKQQEALAKKIAAENKLENSRTELINARLAFNEAQFTYAEKIAKARSERESTTASMFEAQGQMAKMRIDLSNYEQRSQFYYITAPQNGYITQAIRQGLGETVKEQEAIASIVPSKFELAVEMYVRPMDLPLISKGQEVRFLFDGWPAIVFSGWPGFSFGTFKGDVFAIDNIPNDKGFYRVLVAQDKDEESWPKALRPGGGANSIALLNTVPLWYELWRQLNGFPPDYYRPEEGAGEEIKQKAPIQSVK